MFIHFGGLVLGCCPSHNEISVAVATRLHLANEPLPSYVEVLVLDCAFVITVGPVLAGPCSKLRHQNVEGGVGKRNCSPVPG